MDVVSYYGIRLFLLQTVRVQRLADLVEFMAQDIFVLHLVRDPRSMMYSWRHFYSLFLRGLTSTQKVHEYCQAVTEDLAFMHDSIQGTARSKFYYLLRFEDLVLRPAYFIRSIYDAVGIPLGIEVSKYTLDDIFFSL